MWISVSSRAFSSWAEGGKVALTLTQSCDSTTCYKGIGRRLEEMTEVISEEGTASLEGAQKWGTLARRGSRKILLGEEQRIRRWEGKTNFSSCRLAKACLCRPPGEEVILVGGWLGGPPSCWSSSFSASCGPAAMKISQVICPPTDSLLVVNPQGAFKESSDFLSQEAGLWYSNFFLPLQMELGGTGATNAHVPCDPHLDRECCSRVAQTDLFLTLPSPSVWGQSRKSWGWWGRKIHMGRNPLESGEQPWDGSRGSSCWGTAIFQTSVSLLLMSNVFNIYLFGCTRS